jgi:hypothetical protein
MKTHKARTFLRAGVLLAVAVIWGNLAQAQTCSVTWTGNAGNGSWSTASNWSPRKVPGSTSDVCIPTFTTANGAGLDGSASSIAVHSIQVAQGGGLLFGSGKVSIATSLNNQGLISVYGTTLSAGSIDMPNPGEIDVFDNSSITSSAFSNTTGTLWVYPGGALHLADNPVQLQNGNLSGGNWLVSGVLIFPSDILQITTESGAAFDTVVSVDTGATFEDASGNNPLTTLVSVGPRAVLSVPSLTVAQDLTSQGSVSVGTLTVNGTYTLESGASAGVGGSLTATTVNVQAGATLGGGGTVASSVTNNGNVAPSGTLSVTGNYTQASSASLSELFGSGTLHVNSNATLSGALKVTANPKHPPQSGATYTALTAGSINGSFTSHTAGFTLTTSANSIKVTKQ